MGVFKKNKYEKMKTYDYLNDLETLKLIVENNGNINSLKRGSKESALILALDESVSFEVFEFLLKSGINTDLQNKEGNTAVHVCEDIERLKLLIKYGADLNIRNKKSHTPIFECNVHEKVKLLVSSGADVNILDKDENHFLKTINAMDFDLMKIYIDNGLNRFLEKKGFTLDKFIERRSTIEVQAYYENKLKTHPELFRIKT